MTLTITYPPVGRGAFPDDGTGGTLSFDGKKPGPYYRAPANGSYLHMPGLLGSMAVRADLACSINDYAVWYAVKVFQTLFGATADGIMGPKTAEAVKAHQKANSLVVDGVIGPQTCRSLFYPLIFEAALNSDQDHAGLVARVTAGTIACESQFDIGAVGRSTPKDVGIGQINGPSHPMLTVDFRLNPVTAIPWVVTFVEYNLKAMSYDEDAGILAYNLGVGGAKSWLNAGRPTMFKNADTHAYIVKVRAGM